MELKECLICDKMARLVKEDDRIRVYHCKYCDTIWEEKKNLNEKGFEEIN